MSLRARVFLPLLVGTCLALPVLGAQRIGTATQRLIVRIEIGQRLDLRRAALPVLVTQRGDTATYRLTMEVAANVDWDLRLLPDESNSAARVEALDADGLWQPLRVGAASVLSVRSHGPCEPTPVALSIRVIGSPAPKLIRDLRLELTAAQ